VGTPTKEDESSTARVGAAGFHNVTTRSRLARVLKLLNHLVECFYHALLDVSQMTNNMHCMNHLFL
jgi:hypothetical protein